MSQYGNYPPPVPKPQKTREVKQGGSSEPQKSREINETQIGVGCIAIIIFGIVCIGVGILIDKFLL